MRSNLAYALGTLAIIVMIQRLFRGFMATIAVLPGWSSARGGLRAGRRELRPRVAASPWFGVTTPFYFGMPEFARPRSSP